MYDSSPGLILETMQALEQTLEAMLNDWSEAEEALVRTTGQIELVKAQVRLRLKREPPAGPRLLKDDLDARVLIELWDTHEEEMTAQLNAEASVAGFKARYKTADRALSSKQSRLNADINIEKRRR